MGCGSTEDSNCVSKLDWGGTQKRCLVKGTLLYAFVSRRHRFVLLVDNTT